MGKSYIHVDQFAGPKELGEYLLKLDKDDELYNEYFQWKGTGEFINTKFWCRVCSVLHDKKPEPVSGRESWYADINEWWRGEGTCANEGWRQKSDGRAKKDKNILKMSLTENTTLNNRLKVLMGA